MLEFIERCIDGVFRRQSALPLAAVGAKLDLSFDHGEDRARRATLEKCFSTSVGLAQHLMRCGKAARETHRAPNISHGVAKNAGDARIGTRARRIRKRAKRCGALSAGGMKLKSNLR